MANYYLCSKKRLSESDLEKFENFFKKNEQVKQNFEKDRLISRTGAHTGYIYKKIDLTFFNIDDNKKLRVIDLFTTKFIDEKDFIKELCKLVIEGKLNNDDLNNIIIVYKAKNKIREIPVMYANFKKYLYDPATIFFEIMAKNSDFIAMKNYIDSLNFNYKNHPHLTGSLFGLSGTIYDKIKNNKIDDEQTKHNLNLFFEEFINLLIEKKDTSINYLPYRKFVMLTEEKLFKNSPLKTLDFSIKQDFINHEVNENDNLDNPLVLKGADCFCSDCLAPYIKNELPQTETVIRCPVCNGKLMDIENFEKHIRSR